MFAQLLTLGLETNLTQTLSPGYFLDWSPASDWFLIRNTDRDEYDDAADVYWHPDNQTIEFVVGGRCADETFDTFYTINSKGENLTTKLELVSKTDEEYESSIRFGDWSADGKYFFYTGKVL